MQAGTSQYLLLLEDEVSMAWSQPEMQMMQSVERTYDIVNRNAYDKKRTRTDKG